MHVDRESALRLALDLVLEAKDGLADGIVRRKTTLSARASADQPPAQTIPRNSNADNRMRTPSRPPLNRACG